MTIAGLGSPSVPLLPTVSLDAGNRLSVIGQSESQNIGYSVGAAAPLDSEFVNFSDAARELQTPPPGTVQSSEFSTSTVQTANLASATPASLVSGYSAQSISDSESEDLSYSTSLQSLQSLGLIQQGDTLISSSVSVQTQQSQLSLQQNASASQQATAANGETQSSSASQSTLQTASEQSVAVFYTQNWMTPSGQGFVFQEMFRVDQNAATSQTGVSASLASTVSTDAISNAIADAAPSAADAAPAANAGSGADNHAAAKSAATAQLATLSAQVMSRIMGSWLQVPSPANSSGNDGPSNSDNSGGVAAGASAGSTAFASPADQDVITKQTNSLLALFESLGSAVQSPAVSSPVAGHTTTVTAALAGSTAGN